MIIADSDKGCLIAVNVRHLQMNSSCQPCCIKKSPIGINKKNAFTEGGFDFAQEGRTKTL